MNNYLKTYKIILTTKAPVFIGSGKDLNKKEYIYEYHKSKVHIPDFTKMFEFMNKTHRINKFQDYMLNYYGDFSRWLKDNKIYPQEYMQWIDYSLFVDEGVFENGQKNEIHICMKDAYGCPYIPGSSLKGAIRTALLANDILENKSKYSRIASDVMRAELKSRNKMLKIETEHIEQKAFNTLNRVDEKGKPIKLSNAVNDVMSGIRISDSKPLDKSCLILCRKIDESTSGVQRYMPLLRECIKPDTTVEFDLTIDTTLAKITVQDIMKAINNFANHNAQNFDSSFKPNGQMLPNTIVIGGGAGYQTKTVAYPLLGKNSNTVKRISQIISATLGKKIAETHKHYKDESLGISPHTAKRTYYLKKKYTMGVCVIEIK